MHSLFEKFFISSCFRLKYLKHSVPFKRENPFKVLVMVCCTRGFIWKKKKNSEHHWMAVEVCFFVYLAYAEESGAGEGWENSVDTFGSAFRTK